VLPSSPSPLSPRPPSARVFDAIILGAGAAGLFCAALAGRRRVLLLDHAPRAGRKILISGGGRANFTNLNTQPENFLSENPHFAKSALARYTPHDFVALVERYGIAYHAKAPGQLFCDGSASQIVDMLLDLCARAGVELQLETAVEAVEHTGGEYRVSCAPAGSSSPVQPAVFTAPALVVATGGLSIPRLGASGLGYQLARRFGLRVVDPRPALVPLLFDHEDRSRFEGLSGVATEVTASVVDAPSALSFRDKMLITHRGLSGPAILQISSYWRPGQTLELDLAPDFLVTAPLLAPGARRDQAAAAAAWQAALPRRLADRLLAVAAPENWRTPALEAAEHELHHWPFSPAGTEGYEKAEVTAGGVGTDELSARTMEAHRQPGLYFIGEVVDVTGHLGGYNFQWAWASAAAAALAL
jgi:predicted Rossmann fold flavoprotein